MGRWVHPWYSAHFSAARAGVEHPRMPCEIIKEGCLIPPAIFEAPFSWFQSLQQTCPKFLLLADGKALEKGWGGLKTCGCSPALGDHSSYETFRWSQCPGLVILAGGLSDPGCGRERPAVLMTGPSWSGQCHSQGNTFFFSLWLCRSSRSWGRQTRQRMSSLNNVSRISTSNW